MLLSQDYWNLLPRTLGREALAPTDIYRDSSTLSFFLFSYSSFLYIAINTFQSSVWGEILTQWCPVERLGLDSADFYDPVIERTRSRHE